MAAGQVGGFERTLSLALGAFEGDPPLQSRFDTLRKIERGEPTVMIGSYFEVATLVGVELWDSDRDTVERYKDRFRDRLALLPARVRPTAEERAVDG